MPEMIFIKTTQQAVTETQTLNPNPDEENDDTHQPSRWSVLVAALVVAAAAAGRHDARCAAVLRRLAKAAHVPWETIAELEDLDRVEATAGDGCGNGVVAAVGETREGKRCERG